MRTHRCLRSGIPWEMLPQVAWALEHLGWIDTERPRELRDQATRQKDGFWSRLALFGTVAMTYRGNPSAFSALSA